MQLFEENLFSILYLYPFNSNNEEAEPVNLPFGYSSICLTVPYFIYTDT